MSVRAEYLEMQSRDSSTFDNSYQTLGDSLSDKAVLFKIVNNSDQDVEISTDGVTAHDFVPAGGFVLYDLRSNKSHQENFYMQKLTQFYVKGAVAGTGNVYLIAMREV